MKNYYITFLLVLFCIIHLQAQQLPNPMRLKVDSVQALIDSQSKVDTTYVNRLNDLARLCFFDMQFKRGLITTLEARQLARRMHYTKGEGKYYRTLYYLNYFNTLSTFYYNYMAKWAHSKEKQQEESFMPSLTIPNNQKNDKAKSGIEEAIAYFEKHPNQEIQANLNNLYAYLLKEEQQAPYLDKALRLFKENNQPTAQFILLINKMVNFEFSDEPKDAKEAEIEAIKILANTKNEWETVMMKLVLSRAYLALNRHSLSYEQAYQLDRQLEQMGEKELRIDLFAGLSQFCFGLSLYNKAIEYYKKQAILCEGNLNNSTSKLTYIYQQIAFSYIRLKAFDEAETYIEKARTAPVAQQSENTRIFNTTRHYDAMGQLLMGRGKYEEALKNFSHAHSYAIKTNEAQWLAPYMTFYSAQCYQKMGKLQEGIKLAKQSYDKVSTIRNTFNGKAITNMSSLFLSEAYEQTGDSLQAYRYLQVYQKIRKEIDQKEEANHLLGAEVSTVIENEQLQAQQIVAIEKQREIDGLKAEAEKQLLQTKAKQAELDKKIEKERVEAKALENKREQDYKISLLNLDIDSQRKVRTGLLGGLGVFALLLAVLFQQNRAKQRFNQTLAKQKEQIEQQRDQLDKTVTDLKATQAQLIQKEKLASLGELTAGIAHEIQNPLNFVNNFSELSVDLAKEIQEERAKGLGQRDEELIDDLVDDLTQNQIKINHHGKRASSIVKGMLEHSRTSSGKKELTDINALADEYLRLAYHGLRAKDSNFNSDFKTDLDKNLPKIVIQAQDMGRVLLNLINNAFYAVNVARTGSPWVQVSTKKLVDSIEIRVKDNGTGIPEGVKDKIFQPFFTTKPTGEGTGLGLSLAYDIVTKAHGGTLEVESIEGEGTEFIIRLPIK